MRLLITLTLIKICLTAIGQTVPLKDDRAFRIDTLIANFSGEKRIGNDANDPKYYTWDVYNEIKYTYSSGEVVVIENSGPRGGRGFVDSRGIKLGYRIFCTRVSNEASIPLELTITFPADSFPLSSPDAYMKVFILPDTMKHDREISPKYDALIKSGYEAVLHKVPRLQRTINPKDAYLFRIVVLRHHNGSATLRAGFALKGQNLFYRIAPEFKNELIPCGQIVFKK